MLERIGVVPTLCVHPRDGDSGSEPLIDVNVDSESSPKFNWLVDSRLKSPKYLLWPEYDLGVKSSGVALPSDDRRGVGVLSPLLVTFGRYPFIFLFKLPVLFGLALEPKIACFSASRMLSSFFWSYKNATARLKSHIIEVLFSMNRGAWVSNYTRYRRFSSSFCSLLCLYSSRTDIRRPYKKTHMNAHIE